MTNIIDVIPNLISGVDRSAISAFNYSFDVPTKAIMQKGYSTIERMAVTFNEPVYFKEFANTLKNPTPVSTFIGKVRKLGNEYVQVAEYLDRIVKAFSIDKSTTNIIDLVWTANILNALGNTDQKMGEYLSDLMFSLQYSEAYKNSSLAEARTRILEKFENDMNEDMAADYFGINPDQAQDYLGVAYTENPETYDYNKWFDYKTFKEITNFENIEINSTEDLKKAIATPTVSSYRAACSYVKKTYLSSTDPNSPGYCEDELEKEYKATIILSSLAKQLGLGELDNNNSVGFNLLSRIQNLPKLMAKNNPLFAASNLLNEFEAEAGQIVSGEILNKEQEKPQEEEEKDGGLSTDEYIKSQLDVFQKVANRKLTELVNTLDKLIDLRQKNATPTREEKLVAIAKDLNVQLNSNLDILDKKERFITNIDLLIDAVNNRYDEITRAKKFFTQIRKKMGTNLDIEDVAFDKEFLGKKGNLVSPYIESLIKSFYKLLKADPKLKTDKRYRAATGPFRVATLNYRVKADENAAPELSSIFSPVKLSPAKKAEYEAEQELEDLWEQEFDAISKSE